MIFNSTTILNKAIRIAMEEVKPSRYRRIYARRVAKRATELYALYEKKHKERGY